MDENVKTVLISAAARCNLGLHRMMMMMEQNRCSFLSVIDTIDVIEDGLEKLQKLSRDLQPKKDDTE